MNSYGVTHRLLRPARLPISPPPQNVYLLIIQYVFCFVNNFRFIGRVNLPNANVGRPLRSARGKAIIQEVAGKGLPALLITQ